MGNEEAAALVHPSAIVWDHFERVIPLLKAQYLVISALPGYDEERPDDLPLRCLRRDATLAPHSTSSWPKSRTVLEWGNTTRYGRAPSRGCLICPSSLDSESLAE